MAAADLAFLLEGFRVTLWLSILSCLISLVLGTLVGILRVQPLGPLRAAAAVYVEFFRNTPLLIQLFFFYHALPRAGFSLSGFESAMWGLSIYTAAFVAETVRAGILAIHKGQMEAARSLGFGYVGAMRYVVLPQAFSIVIPPLGNLFIALLKNTSLASTIAVAELLYQGEVLEGRTFRTTEILSVVGVLYLSLTLPLGYLVNLLEKRLGRMAVTSAAATHAEATPAISRKPTRLALALRPVGRAMARIGQGATDLLARSVTAMGRALLPLVKPAWVHPGLGPAARWGLYAVLLGGSAAVAGRYLVSLLTTPEGSQPWRMFADFRTWVFLANGVLVTVEVSLVAILLSLVIGTLLALGRLSRLVVIRWPSVLYIEVIRALPVFLMIIFVHLESSRLAAGLSISLSEVWAVILALTIYTVAVNAEVVRAGITSIEKGQTEAARSLGMSYTQMMRWVILPQALQRMIPPLVSQFITLLKDTSLGAVIGLLELLRRAEIIYRGVYGGVVNNNPIETLFVVAVVYFALCYTLSLGSLRLERSWALAR